MRDDDLHQCVHLYLGLAKHAVGVRLALGGKAGCETLSLFTAAVLQKNPAVIGCRLIGATRRLDLEDQ